MEATEQTPPATAENVSTASTLRRVSETFLSILHNRLELITVELKEERHLAVATLMFAIFAATFGMLSLVAVLITVAFLVPAGSRPWVMIGICVIFIGGLLFSVFELKSKLKRPPVLADTLSELKKDIACLKES
jgi:uncharacterized membrane protein YqjE